MSGETPAMGARRQLATRDKAWAQKLAHRLSQTSITPNTISVISVVFSILGALCLMTASYAGKSLSGSLLWLSAALCIQLRLICNLLDGMVAIEGGKKSLLGGLYNELPDRIADPLLLMAAGYSSDWIIKLGGIPLGWVAAVLAVMTAYIRVLGGTLGAAQHFCGPMAKQHRMFMLTLGCFASIAELWLLPDGKTAEVSMTVALAIIIVGSVFTCLRRLRLISSDLQRLDSCGT